MCLCFSRFAFRNCGQRLTCGFRRKKRTCGMMACRMNNLEIDLSCVQPRCNHLCLTGFKALTYYLIFCSFICFCLYGPFNFISFREFSRQLSVFSLCSSGLSSSLLVLSTIYLFMKVCFSPDIIPSGCLGSKHRLTN